MKSIFFLALLITLSPTLAFSGDVGNGGRVVICTDPITQARSAQVYDYFLLGETNRLHYKPSPEKDFLAKAADIFGRVQRLDSYRYEVYMNALEKFKTSYNITLRTQISEISDFTRIVDPKRPECVEKQAAVQRKNPKQYEYKYLFDQDIWNVMDSDQQAGIVTHEVALTVEVDNGATTADGAMMLNSILSSSILESISFDEYLINLRENSLLKTIRINAWGKDVLVASDSIEGEGNTLKSITPLERMDISFESGGKMIAGQTRSYERVYFHPNGVIRECELTDESELIIQDHRFHSNGRTTFDENGRWVSSESMLSVDQFKLTHLDQNGEKHEDMIPAGTLLFEPHLDSGGRLHVTRLFRP